PSPTIRELDIRPANLADLRGIGLITGDSGSGKTCACRKVLMQLHTGLYRVIYVSLSTGNVMDLFKTISWEMGLAVERSRAALYRQIKSEVSRLCGAREVYPAEHALLRRESESQGPGEADEGPRPSLWPPTRVPGPGFSSAQSVFITRLHVRYDNAHFPEDLLFQETADRENFQARYVLRHPWTGDATCEAATNYRQQLRPRQEREAQTLATLTGWDVNDIRKKMSIPPAVAHASAN